MTYKNISTVGSNEINSSFEGEKNKKALMYTTLICGFLLLIAILYTWPMQATPQYVEEDLIEINLGNEEEGFGEVQPLVKGDPAPDNQSVTTNTSTTRGHEAPSQSIQAEESDDAEAAAVVKTEKPKTPAKIENKETSSQTAKNINPSPVTNPNPSPPKPKVPLYKGGTGTGGNKADEDNGYRNQGYKPEGTGDAGSPDGKPDAYGNTPGGKNGISVARGLTNRGPITFPPMTDNFNENAVVYVDIKVDAGGKVTSATIARGTTTSNPTLRNIAIQKAKQLKFPTSQSDLESGTIRFNFVLKS